MRVKPALNVFIILFLVALFTPSLVYHFSFKAATTWGWFSNSPSFSSDFEALEWIDMNIQDSELILNDYSYASLWISSLSIKNVTAIRLFENDTVTRGMELKEIWEHPDMSVLVKNLLKEYDVSYVFSTSEWGYTDVKELGGDHKYKKKPFSPDSYKKLFDSYPFMKLVFNRNNTVIYQVNISEVP